MTNKLIDCLIITSVRGWLRKAVRPWFRPVAKAHRMPLDVRERKKLYPEKHILNVGIFTLYRPEYVKRF
jgi:hypothetical protein